MEEDHNQAMGIARSEHKSFDSGRGSSLPPTPGVEGATAAVHASTECVNREPGELTDTDDNDGNDNAIMCDEGEED